MVKIGGDSILPYVFFVLLGTAGIGKCMTWAVLVSC